MSKITFRADDDLVDRLEAYDASKSEVMREALRAYLDASDSGETTHGSDAPDSATRRSTDSRDTVEEDGFDALIDRRVEELLSDRLDARSGPYTPATTPEVTVNVSLEGASADSADATITQEPERETDVDARKTETETGGDTKTTGADTKKRGGDTENTGADTKNIAGDTKKPTRKTCAQCGEEVPGEHVYCPNCGEKSSRRVFCDCGDELRSDWSFCPGCGRRTPAADVLDPR